MKATIEKLDDTRPVTAAMNGGWFGDGFTDVVDAEGFNYALNTNLDRFHAEHPKLPLYGSEEGRHRQHPAASTPPTPSGGT